MHFNLQMKPLSKIEKHGIIENTNTQLPTQALEHEPSFSPCRATDVKAQPKKKEQEIVEHQSHYLYTTY